MSMACNYFNNYLSTAGCGTIIVITFIVIVVIWNC